MFLKTTEVEKFSLAYLFKIFPGIPDEQNVEPAQIVNKIPTNKCTHFELNCFEDHINFNPVQIV